MTSSVTVMVAPTPMPTEFSPGRPRPTRNADATAAAPSTDRPMMMISAGLTADWNVLPYRLGSAMYVATARIGVKTRVSAVERGNSRARAGPGGARVEQVVESGREEPHELSELGSDCVDPQRRGPGERAEQD